MTGDEAAWVRDNAWTKAMRKTFKELPRFYLTCACQHNGPCLNDPRPETHRTCHVGRHPLARYETVISSKRGYVVAFRDPYRYPDASATGWHYSRLAMVWLADRVCRWSCTCDCGHPREGISHDPARNPRRPMKPIVVAERPTLPGLEPAGSRP